MSRINEGLYSSNDQTWMTPPEVWEAPLKLLGIKQYDIDVACTQENVAARLYLKEHEVDSLQVDWHKPMANAPFPANPICWMNPPYGNLLTLFLQKAYEEFLKGCRVWALVPARTETVYQHEYGLTKAHFTVFLYQRISFIPSDALREKLIGEWIERNRKKYPLIQDDLFLRPMAEKAVDNGVAPFPTMLLYYGADYADVLARWIKNPPLLGTPMIPVF